MRAISLQSGSNGNCIYVETGGVRLLFDAGITAKETERRLSLHNRDVKDVDAIIISHEHADHCKYAGVLQRKFGMPVYITEKTLEPALRYSKIGPLKDAVHFRPGEEIRIGRVTIKTVPTAHDAVEGSVFVLQSEGKSLGIMTDLGHVTDDIRAMMQELDAVFLESNYDPDMLAKGRYPYFLQQRIKGPNGHISNRESAELLLEGTRLQWACLSHLSENCNRPALAIRTHREVLGLFPHLHLASRYEASVMFSVA